MGAIHIFIDGFNTPKSLLTLFSALLTPTLAIVGTVVVIAQYRLQKSRWRLDLYNKRYPTFLNSMEYIAKVIQDGKLSHENLTAFLRGSKDKEFLFSNDIASHLEQLYQKGLRLQTIETTLQTTPVGEKRTNLVDESSEILGWFSTQFEESKRLFAEYLAVSKK